MKIKLHISIIIVAFCLFSRCKQDNSLVSIDQIPSSKIVDNEDELKSVVKVSYEELEVSYQLPQTKIIVSEKFIFPMLQGDRPLQIIASNLVIDHFEMLLLSERSNANINANERMQKVLQRHMDNMKEDYAGNTSIQKQKWFGVYESKVNINNDRYLGLILTYSNYYGGAHGMHGTKYLLLERKALKEVDIHKIITDKVKAKAVIEKHFNSHLRKRNIQRADLFLDDGEYYLTNNFTIRNDSLVFNHHVYEIAPYYIGEIEFGVPLNELKPYLNQDLGL